MGHHKTNPTAIAAKNGDIPPKEKGPYKREIERQMTKLIEDRTGITQLHQFMGAIGISRYF